MKIYTNSNAGGHVVLVNDGDSEGILPLTVKPNCSAKWISFKVFFPENCEVVSQDGHVIFRVLSPDFNQELNPHIA